VTALSRCSFAEFYQQGAMKISSWRFILVVAAAVSLIGYPKPASATTFTVTVGPNGSLVFSPSSITIHPGDQVQWTWGSSGHSTTSGSPGQPNGIWDSGISNQGATFTHTFNSAGTFPYYCTPHGGCCGMVGTVTVVNASPTPTPTPPITGPPVVTTNPATFIASFSGKLNGSLNPHGLTTTFHFQYGTTTSYGLTTAPQTQTGNTSRNVSANVTGLTANTLYHFRIVASNSDGTRMGSDRTFTTLTATGPPVVTTNPATNVTASSATLHGSLDPHGLTTTVHFQYGTTTSYGHTTPMQSQTGNTYRNIAANISGLIPHTTYHFRMVATNSGGTRMGSDRTFITQ
jgi:plastocyanin